MGFKGEPFRFWEFFSGSLFETQMVYWINFLGTDKGIGDVLAPSLE